MNNYKILKEKLSSYSIKNNTNIEDLTDLEKKFSELTSKFTISPTQTEVDKILKEKLVEQYEEQKENITFSTLIENYNNLYFVYMIIFDTDYTYSNLLLKSYSNLEDAKLYFNELKSTIKNNDINTLSLYIIEKM